MSSPLSPTQQLQEKLLLRDDEKISAEARSVVEGLRKEIETLRKRKAAAEARGYLPLQPLPSPSNTPCCSLGLHGRRTRPCDRRIGHEEGRHRRTYPV